MRKYTIVVIGACLALLELSSCSQKNYRYGNQTSYWRNRHQYDNNKPRRYYYPDHNPELRHNRR